MNEPKDTQREPFWVRCDDSTPNDRRNLLRVLILMALWGVTSIGSGALIKAETLGTGPLAWTVALIPFVPVVLLLFAYARYLRETDELQRLIQIGAMALSFGGTFFALSGYRSLERLGAPEADPGDFTLVMAVLYSLGLVLGWMRYR